MPERRHKLIDCGPEWVVLREGGAVCGVRFDCPEGHDECLRVIPFTPALDGSIAPPAQVVWHRTGETFETLTLSPSIRGVPAYASREAALAAGVAEQYIRPSMFCALHIFIHDGRIEFFGDSR